MPRVPFPDGLTGSERLPRTRRELRNCFMIEGGRIIGRPGISQISTTGRVARGQFVWNGALYQVQSQQLHKITDPGTGASTNIGTIAGPQPIRVAIGFNHAVIVVRGGALYTLDSSDTLTDISGNSNFVPCVDVAHINGRFVYVPANGDPAFYSDVGAAGTVQAASFFDAEELPDKNNAVFELRNTLFIGGTDSFELFRNVPGTSAAFTRVSGSRLLHGFIGGLLEYTDTYLFIGREKGQDYGVYAISQGGAVKVSNESVDAILAGYTQSELEETTAGRLKWRGHDLATFAMRRDSFGFYRGKWFRLDTLFSGESRPWGGGYITHLNGTYYTAYENKFGKFDQVNTDYGEPITRIVDTAFEQEEDEEFSCQSLTLGISQGYNTADGSVSLQLSRDNVLYGPPMYRNTGAVGEYDSELRWEYPGGLGQYRGFMGVRLYTTEDIEFSASHMIARMR